MSWRERALVSALALASMRSRRGRNSVSVRLLTVVRRLSRRVLVQPVHQGKRILGRGGAKPPTMPEFLPLKGSARIDLARTFLAPRGRIYHRGNIFRPNSIVPSGKYDGPSCSSSTGIGRLTAAVVEDCRPYPDVSVGHGLSQAFPRNRCRGTGRAKGAAQATWERRPGATRRAPNETRSRPRRPPSVSRARVRSTCR